MIDKPEGRRPVFDSAASVPSEHIGLCPGYKVDGAVWIDRHNGGSKQRTGLPVDRETVLLGPYRHVYCGHATDEEIRYIGSSGGVLTALSLFALDCCDIDYVIHTAMDPEVPWANRTVVSRKRGDLLRAAGSRYVASSPCTAVSLIRRTPGRFVFVGKPCDIAAMRAAIRTCPLLEERVAILLTFFCAGTPGVAGPLNLLNHLSVAPAEVTSVRFRGMGWPGRFRIRLRDGSELTMSYEDAWGFVQKHRPLRCHLCPDGVGELADVSVGDAWNRHAHDNPGLSYVITRTDVGDALVRKAQEHGYLSL
ncbi:MAG: Coenzyme F420 hydrogenase/dehydrogenase, beta subunit C-terminal domain, partial [Rhodothermales bacterium]